jgi:predicted aconitase
LAYQDQAKEEPMMKIALAAMVAAAALALTTAPLATPSKAQELKMAQVDVQIGRDRYDRSDRRRYDNDATIGIGPGGVTVGPRRDCRTVTTTVERGDGRTVTRRERRCD